MITLMIREQNAGVLISRADTTHVHFEVFELSPTNRAVMNTKGRLKRSFPALAVALAVEDMRKTELRSVLAHTLAEMSLRSAMGTKPRVRKAAQYHDEDRDTVHPKVVTELLISFLSAIGKPVGVSGIVKNTREDVLWNDSLLPWRRSPLWLLIRVTLQLMCTRQANKTSRSGDPYKLFMVLLMSNILDKSCQLSLPSDLIYIMTTKIWQRLLKLNSPNSEAINCVVDSIRKADSQLRKRWSKIQAEVVNINHKPLATLNFEQDSHYLLPKLDGFIKSVATWTKESSLADFHPQTVLIRYASDSTPRLPHSDSRINALYALHAFENWVDVRLNQWLKCRSTMATVAEDISTLIMHYHQVARDHYKDDPEALSSMLLTIIELWIVCDQSAVDQCHLLSKYNPDVPLQLFQSLILPRYHDMERLNRVEKYLRTRQNNAVHSSAAIFQDFGTQGCFAVNYFEQSPMHQALLRDIEDRATREKAEKCNELRSKQAEYQNLMSISDRLTCEYTEDTNDWTGLTETHHRRDCQKCHYRTQAQNLDIKVHEWPLPQGPLDARSTVFEMAVPESFGHWRDITTYLLFDVLRSKYATKAEPRSSYPLSTYEGLSSFYVRYSQTQRVCLLSQEKPHAATHRRKKPIMATTESDVCVNNGLRYQYYDNDRRQFIVSPIITDEVPEQLVFQLPKQSKSLQKYLFRPPSSPNGLPPNSVIANQSDCPEQMSLDEYKALAAMGLGYEIQWQNLLLQLSAPSVDFKKEETTLAAFQLIYQAGPLNDNERRLSHNIFEDESFTAALLTEVREAYGRVKENWESSEALHLFINITLRVLTLVRHGDAVEQALSLLSDLRRTAFDWTDRLQDKASQAPDITERTALSCKAVEIALICVQSFHVDLDPKYLDRVMSRTSCASIFLRCSIIISDGLLSVSSNSSFTIRVLLRRWAATSYDACQYLSSLIVAGSTSCLDDTLAKVLPNYRTGSTWQRALRDHEDWLFTKSNTPGFEMIVHFNLVSGKLLVNGLPLSRLPPQYEETEAYRELFGQHAIDVVPSTLPGMQFCTKTTFAGHEIYFGLDTSNNHKHGRPHLRVQSQRDGTRRLLVPRELLADDFPTHFSSGFVHWYDSEADAIEFCPFDQAWTTSTTNWKLTRSLNSPKWCLSKDTSKLVGIHSETGRIVSEVLASLEDPSRIHIIHDSSLSAVEVIIHQLQLNFYLDQGETRIRSKQFRGMEVDADQSIGTLVGLQSKLVLRHEVHKSRLLIVPEGTVYFVKAPGHVRVSIDQNSMDRFHAYHLDDLLGRLVDNGSARSKLFIAYLHALTSFCLPDKLTGRTGTEQALSILQSAHFRSFDQLTEEEISILEKISLLTPGRKYYPSHERVMQKMEWSRNIGFLAQHGMFATVAQSIFDTLNKTSMFYPQNRVRVPDVEHVDWDLLQRDGIRSSTFWIAGFGAEQYSTDHDQSYCARDQDPRSKYAVQSYEISSFVFQGQPNLPFAMPGITTAYLWQRLQPARHLHGPDVMLNQADFKFDADLLRESFKTIATHWTGLHKQLARNRIEANRFALMMWLSTLAFHTDTDIHLVLTLASFIVLPQMASIEVPECKSFDLHLGVEMKEKMVQSHINSSLKSFSTSPEGQSITKRSPIYLKHAKHTEFQRKQNQAAASFVTKLLSQWPCRVPQMPADEGHIATAKYINTHDAMNAIGLLFKTVYDNCRLHKYLDQIQRALSHSQVCPRHLTKVLPHSAVQSNAGRVREVFAVNLFAVSHPVELLCPPADLNRSIFLSEDEEESRTSSLPALLGDLETRAKSLFEIDYVQKLRDSHQRLPSAQFKELVLFEESGFLGILTDYRCMMKTRADQCFSSISRKLHDRETHLAKVSSDVSHMLIRHFTRLSPTFLLEQLSHDHWKGLSKGWQEAIVQYAVCITQLQRADRMLKCASRPKELLKEIQNPGHSWDPKDQPESLLLEIESNIMIRDVQQQIAREMKDPRDNRNATMQLNMGEGKSSVIAPITAMMLADASRLVRVIVAKPLARQMFQLMASKLGGLVNRRIYRMPFSRELKLDDVALRSIHGLCEECMKEGGILLVQPEHLLSLKLMGLECLISRKTEMAQSLMRTLTFFDEFARDIVDESDEIFNVKFELVYSMGTQQPIEFSPERWSVIQQILDFSQEAASQILHESPTAIEFHRGCFGSFPRIRLLNIEVKERFNSLVTELICKTGFHGFPISQQPKNAQLAVQKYISEAFLNASEITQIKENISNSFWDIVSEDLLLLLRGLLAGGILSFALGDKRWRVNYGLDATRQPVKRLAVPYRAKDNPSLRSEFSHPDVVLVLTSLSYYYGGLTEDDLFVAFGHLLKSDQADIEYQTWVRQASGLPPAFHQLCGINLKDRGQCIEQVFPPFRFAKSVVDYFLSHIVFPKEMREFPKKLTASGWDLGEVKRHPTTGFSGTVDLKRTLPLAMNFQELPSQEHTNALVLEHLLHPKNFVAPLPPRRAASDSDFAAFLNLFETMASKPRVILDVGAQILDRDNLGVVRDWLGANCAQGAHAAIFFDDNDELCVFDRSGRIEPLQVSSYAKHLDDCLVYLDEAHTRGTDLKMPDDWLAAVTLGPNVTKDRLVQGKATIFALETWLTFQ